MSRTQRPISHTHWHAAASLSALIVHQILMDEPEGHFRSLTNKTASEFSSRRVSLPECECEEETNSLIAKLSCREEKMYQAPSKDERKNEEEKKKRQKLFDADTEESWGDINIWCL